MNKGTLLIYGKAPFDVEFYEEGKTFNCLESPCKIVDRIGIKNFLVTKENHDSLATSAQIKLWGTTEAKIDLKALPHFEKVEKIPESKGASYALVFDTDHGMQKLIRTGDKSEEALVYFQKQIKNPEIFAGENVALIIDKGSQSMPAYKVDLIEKSKQPIESLKNIASGKWSPDAKYFAFSVASREPNLWLMDEKNKVSQTNLTTISQQTAWLTNDKLLAVSGVDFSEYDPVTDQYTKIISFQEPALTPTNLTVVDGKVYFQAGENSYQLILE